MGRWWGHACAYPVRNLQVIASQALAPCLACIALLLCLQAFDERLQVLALERLRKFLQFAQILCTASESACTALVRLCPLAPLDDMLFVNHPLLDASTWHKHFLTTCEPLLGQCAHNVHFGQVVLLADLLHSQFSHCLMLPIER